MAIFGETDIPTMLTDWGNVLEFEGVETPCSLMTRELPILESETGAPQISRELTAIYETSKLAGLKSGDLVMIDAVEYTVWQALENNGITELLLRLT